MGQEFYCSTLTDEQAEVFAAAYQVYLADPTNGNWEALIDGPTFRVAAPRRDRYQSAAYGIQVATVALLPRLSAEARVSLVRGVFSLLVVYGHTQLARSDCPALKPMLENRKVNDYATIMSMAYMHQVAADLDAIDWALIESIYPDPDTHPKVEYPFEEYRLYLLDWRKVLEDAAATPGDYFVLQLG